MDSLMERKTMVAMKIITQRLEALPRMSSDACRGTGTGTGAGAEGEGERGARWHARVTRGQTTRVRHAVVCIFTSMCSRSCLQPSPAAPLVANNFNSSDFHGRHVPKRPWLQHPKACA